MSTPIANMPRGIDVSKFQREVDWSRVSASGRTFAFARVIDDRTGTTPDPFFVRNFRGMRAAGLLRGAYHLFNSRRNARAAANLFVSIVGSLGPGDLQPVIDVEKDGINTPRPGAGVRAVLDAIALWIDIVESALRRQVIIYTNFDTWNNILGNTTRFSDHPLWISSLRTVPQVPSAFRTFSFHQHSFTGSVPGVNGDVDLDRFNGNMNGLRAFADLPPIEGVLTERSVPSLAVAGTRGASKRAASVKSARKSTKSVKAGAKKKGTKKGAAKKGVAKKAAAKRGTKKQSSARKGAAKRGAKRASKKTR